VKFSNGSVTVWDGESAGEPLLFKTLSFLLASLVLLALLV
jgi:hypothetical protein